MKKAWTICAAIIIFGLTSTKAQGILDKADRALSKADRASNTADRAAGTADKAGGLGKKISGLFGKKSKEEGETSTTIKFTGVDFAALKAINEKIQTATGVTSSKMKFSASGSTIKLQHAGTTEDILKALQKASPATFAEKNIEGLDDGEIAVNIKK